MSGGHFDYNCFAISRFAEDLEHEINVNDSEEKNEYGDNIGFKFDKKTIVVLQKCQNKIRMVGLLAKEIEWLYSGDHSEETFLEIVKSIGYT